MGDVRHVHPESLVLRVARYEQMGKASARQRFHPSQPEALLSSVNRYLHMRRDIRERAPSLDIVGVVTEPAGRCRRCRSGVALQDACLFDPDAELLSEFHVMRGPSVLDEMREDSRVRLLSSFALRDRFPPRSFGQPKQPY